MNRLRHATTRFIQLPRLQLFMAVTLLLLSLSVYSWQPGDKFTHFGLVMGQGTVLSDNGNPYLVEFDTAGEEVYEIGERQGDLADVSIFGAATYRAEVQAYRQQLAHNLPQWQGHCIISIENYGREHCGNSSITVPATTPDGRPTTKAIQYPTLPGGRINSIVLRHSRTIVDPELIGTTGPVLLTSRIDLNNIDNGVIENPTIRSLLLTPQGQVYHKTQNNIGLRVAFLKEIQGGTPQDVSSRTIFNDKPRVTTPFAGIKITASNDVAYPSKSQNFSDASGYYVSQYYQMPCPCHQYNWDGFMLAQIPFRNFQPQTKAKIPLGYFQVSSPVFDTCSGLSHCLSEFNLTEASAKAEVERIESDFIINTAFSFINRADLYVDIMILTGEGGLYDINNQPIPLRDQTTYKDDRQHYTDLDPQSLQFDFDGDRLIDRAVLYNGQYHIYLGGACTRIQQQPTG